MNVKVESVPGVMPHGGINRRGWRAFCWDCNWISKVTAWHPSAIAMRNAHAFEGCKDGK